MNLLKSFLIAFSMYSQIPVPQVDWDKKSMAYAMAFFPWVGAVIGIFMVLWAKLALAVDLGAGMFAAGAIFIPLIITGAIHLDGLCDTMDAICSHKEQEKRLEILKDPHIGAFALICTCVYFIVHFGLWTEVNLTFMKDIYILAIGFALTRSLSAFSVVTFKCAKSSGVAAAFADNSQRNNVRAVVSLYALACAAAMLYIDIFVGGMVLLATAISFLLYRQVSYRDFGGITGDLAGFFVQICELLMVLAVVIAQILIKVGIYTF